MHIDSIDNMAWTKKPELNDYAWADRVDLLRDYFVPDDLEWEGYRKIFGATDNLKLIELNTLCGSFVMPTDELTVDDFVTGAYKDKLWQYALAALVVRSCEE